MPYSLLSRFQGTLWGAALGELLGTYVQTQLQAGRSIAGLDQGRWIAESASDWAGWSQAAIDCAHCLIDNRALDLSLPLPAIEATGLAVAALPIALFFHEDPEKLRDRLGKMLTGCGGDAKVYSGVLAVSHTIALALQERLHPPSLIPQLLHDLDLSRQCPDLANQLLQVQAGIEQRIGLSQMKLRSNLSIAFYCFLSTPEDYSLTVRRSAQGTISAKPGDAIGNTAIEPISIGATAIAGALSGVYNSRTGIPLDWLLRSAPAPLVKSWPDSAHQSASQIDSLASQLLAVWSGRYQPGNADAPVAAVAAPDVIRPR